MKSILSRSCPIVPILAVIALGLGFCESAQAVFTWNGTNSSDVTDASNWGGNSVPTFGTSINDLLWVQSGANPMNYTSSQGTTSFALSTNSNISVVGQTTTGVLNISGGTLNITGAHSGDSTTESLWIGNGNSPKGNGTVNVSGSGTFNTTYSLLIGRDGGNGALNISGGTVTVTGNGVNLSNLGSLAANGNGTITLSGSGSLVIQGATTASSGTGCISFRSGASTSTNYINFVTGGNASLSLLSTADNFAALVSGSLVRINSVITTDTTQFTKTTSGGQNIYKTVQTTPPPVPVITSAATASGTVGSAFSYQITASNSPTSFNATGLPGGLSVNTATGLISGTLYLNGASNITLSAVNFGGTGSATLTLTTNSTSTTAKPFLHPLFSNHMVLQRDSLDSVWGWTLPGLTVTVTVYDQNGSVKQSQTVTAGADGKWQALVGPFGLVTNNAAYSMSVTGPGSGAGSQTVTLTDILIGDVWLCSGQSNMERELGTRTGQANIINYSTEIANANFPTLRDFYVPETAATTPQATVANTAAQTSAASSYPAGGVWSVWSPSNAAVLTAVGYFFARDLYQATNVPIGVLHSAYGGTTIDAWLETNSALGVADYTQTVSQLPSQSSASKTTTTGLYNAMIAPLTPFSIKGALWYQGESDVNAPQRYSELLPALMKGWRSAFNNPSLPFIVVQLPNFNDTTYSTWPELREAQLKSVLNDANARVTVNIDIGDPTNLHPMDKQDVGQRAAWAALNLAYGQSLTYSGPIFTGATVSGSTLRCSFDQVGAGLMTGTKSYSALTPATQTSGTLTGFVISGTDKVFYNATATIDAQTNTVVVSSTNVPSPVAVRYGWSNTPTCNLYAKITGTNGTVVDGLPASPFRNDPVAQLNVVNGTGSASGLSPNQVVGISANSAPTNQSFAFWSGDADLLANSGGTSTTATMGRTYVSVLTNYSLNTAPTGLTGYASGLRSLLTWKALTNANSYNIKRSAFSGGPYTLIATGITTTYFVDNSTGAGTPWYYVVSANNSAGESPNSAQVAVTPSLPAAPSAFTATAGNGMAFLSWNLVPNATGYTLSRTTTSGSGYTQVSAALTGTTFVDTGLSNGTTYYYTLASQFNGATGPASAEISVAPNASGSSDPGDKTPPVITTPGNLVVDATGTNGAPVSFAATAYDAISGFANVTCSPASGSVFPIGTTTVQCSAVDATGNVATASFSITVRLTLSVWRQIHFGTSSNSGAAADNADPDGDGMTNAMEFVAGTDPMSAASCIKVSQLAPTGNDIQVSFPSVVGKTYDLQVSPTLQADSWTLVQGGITGTGSTIQVTDPNGNGQPKRFYRILVH